MVQNKSFRGFLVLNWKDGSFRSLSRKPTSESPYELCVGFNVTVNIPEKPFAEIKGNVDLPETKILEAVADNI